MPPSGDLFTEQTDNSCRPWLQRNARKVQTKSETLSDPNLCNSQLSLNRANYLPRFQLYPFVREAYKKLPRSCSSNNKVALNCIPCKLVSSWRFSFGWSFKSGTEPLQATGCPKKKWDLCLNAHNTPYKWTTDKSRMSFEKFRKFPSKWAQEHLYFGGKWLRKRGQSCLPPLFGHTL